jgi:hypothetical protein
VRGMDGEVVGVRGGDRDARIGATRLVLWPAGGLPTSLRSLKGDNLC